MMKAKVKSFLAKSYRVMLLNSLANSSDSSHRQLSPLSLHTAPALAALNVSQTLHKTPQNVQRQILLPPQILSCLIT